MPDRATALPSRLRIATAVLGLLAGLLAVLGVPSSGAAAAPAPAEDNWRGKVAGKVEKSLDRQDRSDFLVTFDQRADLTGAAKLTDWRARGEYVVDALVATAKSSQRSARAVLKAHGVDFEAFWVTNVIVVRGGDTKLARDLAGLSVVDTLAPAADVELPDPEPTDAEARVQSLEWNISAVGADQAWAEFGARGQGIVVGSIDTGVQVDHPALVRQYRGNNGDGTFTHAYNWFDPGRVCGAPSAGPCDNISHGTHTVGTMVGDDGAGHQIGVAPQASWIAAKGCLDEQRLCPIDALLASGQWMLAPTDLTGANPRPDLRPHIINNSWGEDNGGFEDSWYDEMLASWKAAGIFAVFSNGNSGPACDTSGSPADSALAYGVGAYGADGAIGVFSSRGPGADGDIRPSISAPGVAVRSAVPDNRYATSSGTSMAAPHVAATVALMWSVAPSLIGDPAETREILDETAEDVADLSCGGTPDDNNVWGEGRLDSHAAVAASPVGEAGTLSGRVTDAATGEELAGATVTAVNAPYRRSTTTDADGRYDLTLVAGDYHVTIGAYGYVDGSADATVTAGETAAHDVALATASMTTVTGTVSDGSGHGFPLYATVTVEGVPLAPVHTDPETGAYEITLPRGDSFTAHVQALYPGYDVTSVELTTTDESQRRDVALTAATEGCLAPGYTPVNKGLFESFDTGELPEGWTVDVSVGDGWEFDDPGGRGNKTGGDGGFASIDSATGARRELASLVSPAIDLSAETDPVLAFRTDYLRGSSGTRVVEVDVSLDGGTTWTNRLHQEKSRRGPELIALELPQAAGQSDVRVRFHYHSQGWWQVDDVLVGRRACEPVDGGLVVGTVTEDLGDQPVVGATVAVSDTEVSARSARTEYDDAEDDGLFWMFAPTGSQTLDVSHDVEQYGARTQTVDVLGDETVRADLTLGVGRLEVDTASLTSAVDIGEERQVEITLRNTGTAPASYNVVERPGTVAPTTPGSPGGAPVQRVASLDTGGRVGPAMPSAADPGAAAPAVAGDGEWERLAHFGSLGNADVLAVRAGGKVYSFGGTNPGEVGGQDRVYDIATDTWSRIAEMPVVVTKPAGGHIGGKVYVVGGWEFRGDAVGITQIYDPATDTWSRGADLPTGVAASGYAVVGDRLYIVGGRPAETDVGLQEVWSYDPAQDEWTRMSDYPTPISWPACGTLDGLIYCAAGMIDGSTRVRNTYAYDPATDVWYRRADAPKTIWGSAFTAQGGRLLLSGGKIDEFISNEGFAYDPAGDTWASLPRSSYLTHRNAGACGLYKVGGYHPPMSLEDPWGNMPWLERLEGQGSCDSPGDAVAWLDVADAAGTLDPGESATVTVTLSAERTATPKTRKAVLLVQETTRFAVPTLEVDLDVTARPAWGGIQGTVTGPAGCGGPAVPLAGVEVQLDGRFHDATVTTDAKGHFEYWLHTRNGRTTVTAEDSERRTTSTKVRVRPHLKVQADLRMELAGPC